MRSVFVQRKVLELYQDMDSVSYPIQPELLLQCIPKSCRILSYQEMAEVTGCTVQDVAVLCKSNSGATHYDPDNITNNSRPIEVQIGDTIIHGADQSTVDKHIKVTRDMVNQIGRLIGIGR